MLTIRFLEAVPYGKLEIQLRQLLRMMKDQRFNGAADLVITMQPTLSGEPVEFVSADDGKPLTNLDFRYRLSKRREAEDGHTAALPDDAEPLLEALRDSGFNIAQIDDYVDYIIDCRYDPGDALDNTEEILRVLRNLTELFGESAKAADWIFRSKGFNDISGNDLDLHIENGDFWTIANTADFLSIIVKYKDDPDALYRDLFDYTPQRAAS